VYDEGGHLTGSYASRGGAFQETVWLGDLPVAVLSQGQPFYIAPDHLGAPHEITNSGGQLAWRWDHDPFGNGLPSGPFSYDLRFPGQFYDRNAKLHYNYFRDYDPKTGRYIESDPIGLAGGTSTYSYVSDRPNDLVDPKGLGPEELLAAPILCALNPICRIGAIILGQRIASNFILSNAAAIENAPLVIAATNENNPASVAAGLMCGAVKGALPEGTITLGIPTPTFGNEIASQSGELLMETIKNFDSPERSTSIPQGLPNTPLTTR
jgi:RHS repeat-associated protein